MRKAMAGQGRRERGGLFGAGFEVWEIEQKLLFLFRFFALTAKKVTKLPFWEFFNLI